MILNKMILISIQVFVLTVMAVDCFGVQRRSAAPERSSDDYPDYQLGVKYDEYPVSIKNFKFSNVNVNLLLCSKLVYRQLNGKCG